MKSLVFPVLIVFAIIFGACGATERKDADTTNQTVDRSSANVIAFPDRFRNVAEKCDGNGWRVFSNSTGDSGTGAELVVVRDEKCN